VKRLYSDMQWRDFVDRWDVPSDVLADTFDYQNPEEATSGFFHYNGCWYHLDQFMRFGFPGESKPDWAGTWDGYSSDSFFSGVVIKLSDDGEQYKIGTYFS
jgi:hypothetical protein